MAEPRYVYRAEGTSERGDVVELELVSSVWEHPWTRYAACAQLSLEQSDAVFFCEGTGQERQDAAEQARKVCEGCPVRAQCQALLEQMPRSVEGVWAGTTKSGRLYPKGVPERRPGRRSPAQIVKATEADVCTVPLCDGLTYSLGFCRRCYARDHASRNAERRRESRRRYLEKKKQEG